MIPISIIGVAELNSWQFDLTFNPTIVQANLVIEGPFLSRSGTNLTLFGSGFILSNLISGINDFYSDVPPGPSGSGVLAEIQFQALAQGLSPLTLSSVYLDLFDQGYSIVNGQITVSEPMTTAPEPITLALLSSGLVLLRVQRLTKRL